MAIMSYKFFPFLSHVAVTLEFPLITPFTFFVRALLLNRLSEQQKASLSRI